MSASHERPSTELRLFPAPPREKRSPSKKRNLESARAPIDDRAVSPAPTMMMEDGRQSAMGGRETPQSQYHTQSPNPHQQAQPFNQPLSQSQSHPQPHSQFQYQTPPQSVAQSQYTRVASPLTVPPPVEFPRSHTSFSEAPTLVRSNSITSHTSPFNNSPPRNAPALRSIFPRYNPELPLEHQPYYPQSQPSSHPTYPTPLTLNRRPYSPEFTDEPSFQTLALQSPMPIGLSAGLFPTHLQDTPPLPSTNEEMRELWKVTNGWRVSASEGRRFCLRMSSALEEPVHTLSSSTAPFYTLRLDPTSTSAIVTLSRQDPNKSKPSSSPKFSTSSKPHTGQDVLTTTLEEPSRRLPPNDGLVALLYPRAASTMAIELATKASRRENANPLTDGDAVILAAERECGRLVFDSDTGKYYLVHPCMATPFYISMHSSPAWSRSEYTLEHPELPRNLIRLSRDGSGGGVLEIDTAVAAKIDCFYIVDVAVTAVMLVAIAEEKNMRMDRFEGPPPSIAPASPHLSMIGGGGSPGGRKGKKEKSAVRIEEMEMDLESQDSVRDMKLKKEKKQKDKVPGFFGLLWMLIKFFAWIFALFFRGIGKVSMFVCRGCRTRKGEKL